MAMMSGQQRVYVGIEIIIVGKRMRERRRRMREEGRKSILGRANGMGEERGGKGRGEKGEKRGGERREEREGEGRGGRGKGRAEEGEGRGGKRREGELLQYDESFFLVMIIDSAVFFM